MPAAKLTGEAAPKQPPAQADVHASLSFPCAQLALNWSLPENTTKFPSAPRALDRRNHRSHALALPPLAAHGSTFPGPALPNLYPRAPASPSPQAHIKGAPDCTASKRPTLSSPPLHRTGEPLVYFSVERWGRSPLALTMQDVRLDGGNRHQLIYVRGGLAGGTRGRAGGLHACGGPTGGGGGACPALL